MTTLKTLLDNTAVNMFLGTLPLLLTIAWGLVSNNKQLDAIVKRLDRIDIHLDSVEANVHSIDTRLTRVETKIDGGRMIV